jgi:lysophospholipase L1-like esterase
MKTYLFYTLLAVLMLTGIWYFMNHTKRAITNYPPKNQIIVAFGDSLVAGQGATPGNDFISELTRKLGRPIINLGVPGNTTADGVARIGDAEKQNPGIVLLLLGGNDSLRRIDVETTRSNLATLITRFQSKGAVVVLLGVRGGLIRDGREGMYKELANEYGTIYVPDILDGIFLKPELMYDAIHPNDAGYAIIADRLYGVFKEYGL